MWAWHPPYVIAAPSSFPLIFPVNSRAFPCDTDAWFRYDNNSCCGPNGHGYTFDIPSKSLRVVAPVAALCAKILLVAAHAAAGAASGGALELVVPGGGGAADMRDYWAGFLSDEAMGAIEQVGSSVGGDGGGDQSDVELAALGAKLQALTGNAYAKVKTLLNAVDKPDLSGLHKHLGLQHLDGGSGPSIAKKWACKECEAGFIRDGADFKPGAKGGGGGGAAEDEADYPPLPPPAKPAAKGKP